MLVGEEDVRVTHVNAQLAEPPDEGLAAGLHAEARVYEQVPPPALRAYHVGVEVAQGVPRQGDGDGEDIALDVRGHGFERPFTIE